MDHLEESMNTGDDDSSIAAVNDPFAPVIFEENCFLTSLKRDHDESFESSTNVIDEAIDRALRLIDTASEINHETSSSSSSFFAITVEEDSSVLGAEEHEPISVEDAVAIWKGLGKEEQDSESTLSPSLDRLLTERTSNKHDGRIAPKDSGCTDGSKIEVDALAQTMCVEITIGDKNLAPPQIRRSEPKAQQPPKGLFEATLDAVGMDKLLGIDEESLNKIGTQKASSNYTPFAGVTSSSSRLNSSPNECDIDDSNETHPESLQQLLWDRLAGLCEPIQLELNNEGTKEKAIHTTNSIASGKFY